MTFHIIWVVTKKIPIQKPSKQKDKFIPEQGSGQEAGKKNTQ